MASLTQAQLTNKHFDACSIDDAVASQPKIKKMLAQGVLSIAIRADFWPPQKNERKAELVKYWHQRAVLDRMNIQIFKKVANNHVTDSLVIV